MTNTAQILPFHTHHTVCFKPRKPVRVLPPVPASTADLSHLITGNTLVIADAENIMISARDHGLKIDFASLAAKLTPAGFNAQLHAAFSRKPSDNRTETMLAAAGWQAHARDIVWVPGPHGPVKKANADTLFAAIAGMLVAAYRPDSLILLTGDGCLACDTVQAIRCLIPDPITVSTLAVSGSVSSRLNPAINPMFHDLILLGQDVMTPASQIPQQQTWHGANSHQYDISHPLNDTQVPVALHTRTDDAVSRITNTAEPQRDFHNSKSFNKLLTQMLGNLLNTPANHP